MEGFWKLSIMHARSIVTVDSKAGLLLTAHVRLAIYLPWGDSGVLCNLERAPRCVISNVLRGVGL